MPGPAGPTIVSSFMRILYSAGYALGTRVIGGVGLRKLICASVTPTRTMMIGQATSQQRPVLSRL